MKDRPPPRPAVVTRVDAVTPRVLRIGLQGEVVANFAIVRPTAHIKIFFDDEPTAWIPTKGAPRPPSRTYTPRRIDATHGQVDVEFVLHGDGLASNWAAGAKPGDTVLLGAPGGGLEVPQSVRHVVILADETALPAAATILEALPDECDTTVLCEVEAASEMRPLTLSSRHEPRWLHRHGRLHSTALEGAVRTLNAPPDAFWWVACEANAMRRIRAHLISERAVPTTHLVTRGYWLAGARNHPDHDYGDVEDARAMPARRDGDPDGVAGRP